MFHQDFQTLENNYFCLVLSSVFSCLEILIKHSPSFMKCYIHSIAFHSISNDHWIMDKSNEGSGNEIVVLLALLAMVLK